MKALAVICLAILVIAGCSPQPVPLPVQAAAALGSIVALVGIVAGAVPALLLCWGLARSENPLILKDRHAQR